MIIGISRQCVRAAVFPETPLVLVQTPFTQHCWYALDGSRGANFAISSCDDYLGADETACDVNKILDVKKNRLQDCPEAIGSLSRLKRLELDGE